MTIWNKMLLAAVLWSIGPFAFAHEGHIYTVPNSEYMRIEHRGGGSDWMVDYGKIATKVATSGRWSEIWKGNEPGPSDIVLIPEHVSVIYDLPKEKAARVKAIALKGSLTFDAKKSTELRVGTLLMYSGKFTIDNPHPLIKTDIIFTGDDPTDKMQFNLGFMALGGEVNVRGAKVSPSFLKVRAEKGTSTISIGTTTPWRIGDELFFSDSQSGVNASHWSYSHVDPKFRGAMPQRWEKKVIKSVVNGVITLDTPLAFAHAGYVANVTRNVEFRSEGPHRGHLMFAGQTKLTLANTRIHDMGRTTVEEVDDIIVDKNGLVTHAGKNTRARYALHLHHNRNKFLVEGNVVMGSEVRRTINGTIERAIAGSPRWGIVNHDSFGDIKNNIVIGAAGSGIVGEDGIETGTVTGNLVIGTGQGTGGGDDGRFSPAEGIDLGYGGFGYWFRGPFMEVDNNIAAGYFKQAGFGYFLHPEFSKSQLPNIAGMLPEYKGKNINVNSRGIRSFKNNISDGIFGDSAFSIFYSSVPHAIDTFFATNGNKNGKGMDIRYTKSFTINNSRISGLAGGIGIHSNKETGKIVTINTHISGFKTDRKVN